MTTSSTMKCCDGNCVRRWPLASFGSYTYRPGPYPHKGKGVCVRDVCAILYDNNISPSLLMIIIKIIILYLIQIRHTDDFPPTGTLLVIYNCCYLVPVSLRFGDVEMKNWAHSVSPHGYKFVKF